MFKYMGWQLDPWTQSLEIPIMKFLEIFIDEFGKYIQTATLAIFTELLFEIGGIWLEYCCDLLIGETSIELEGLKVLLFKLFVTEKFRW